VTRREEREQAFFLIFEASFSDYCDIELIIQTAIDERAFDNSEYIYNTVIGTINNLNESDKLIGEYSKGWNINRISRVSLAILRMAIYEVLHNENIPQSVAINEAVELAKKYDNDDAPPFINGVLGSIVRRDV